MAYISFQPQDYFNTKLWTGTDATHAITGVGFEPDLVWIKGRTTAYNHVLNDQVRGVNKELRTSGTNAEITQSDSFTSFDSDGFTLGADSSDQYNNTSNNYVGWSWRASGTSGSSNTDGSINTTYTSANTTSGMSIIQYSGNGTAGATIGHGLGVAPKCVIIKRTDTTSNWIFGTGATGFTKFLYLNTTGAETTNSGTFNNTAPSSSVITLGSWNDVNNSSGTYIAYCFADVQGFSKVGGSYTGNGSLDAPFLYCGFKPAWLIIKKTNSTGNWIIMDNKRNPFNEMQKHIAGNTNEAEDSSTSYNDFDFLSNGVKIREDNGDINASGSTYIYMAFAESPLVSSNGVPATAR